MEGMDGVVDIMETETFCKAGDEKKIVDGNGKVQFLKTKERHDTDIHGGAKRPRSSDSDEENKVTKESKQDSIANSIRKVQEELMKLDELVGGGEVGDMRHMLKNMYVELESALYEHMRGGVNCNRCQGVPSPLKDNKATQTDHRAEIEELKKRLIDGVGKEALPGLIRASWPAEFFQQVRKVGKKPESDEGNLIIVHDMSGGPNRNLALAPVTELKARKGKVVLGQLLAEPQVLEDLLATTSEDKAGRILTLVLDSRDMERSVYAASAGIKKINELVSETPTYLVSEGSLGTAFMKVLEYELRRSSRVADCYLAKMIEKRRSAPPAIPSQVMVVSAQGRTYADLLKEVKNKVPKEEAGDVLSVRKVGGSEDLHIRVKVGPDSDKLRDAIASRVEGVKVSQGGRRQRPVVFHIKDLEEDTNEEAIRRGLAEELKEPVEKFKVSAVRPAYGNTRNATVIVPGNIAGRLKVTGRVRIGWVACRIVPREEITRCYRCFEVGHMARECTGEDRTKQCFNCGQEGHKKSVCENVMRCGECGSEDHRMGSSRCLKKN